MYKYETHLHTYPVSGCAEASVEDNLEFYKKLGYDGVFITNHFLDGNINISSDRPYEEKIEFYFSDIEKGIEAGKKIGIKVFYGFELGLGGTDFLVYGLDKEWCLAHPEIMEMDKKVELGFMMDCGALVIQAHPFREAGYINHIRLFPRSVHGIEVLNANRTDAENSMAKIYAEHYGLLQVAGSDNHRGAEQTKFAGLCFDTPIESTRDFIDRVKAGTAEIFSNVIE